MERFCDKCGTLVSGEGKFCPSCGAPLESAVDLGKPDIDTPVQTEQQPSPYVAPVNNTYSGTSSSNQGQIPAYPQSYNTNSNASSNNDMTIGKWLLTFLISAIPIVGLIMLFIWAFGDDGNTTRQTFSKAYLLWTLISVGATFILYFGMIMCIGSMMGGLGNILSEMEMNMAMLFA